MTTQKETMTMAKLPQWKGFQSPFKNQNIQNPLKGSAKLTNPCEGIKFPADNPLKGWEPKNPLK
jgi:hypothetical protein